MLWCPVARTPAATLCTVRGRWRQFVARMDSGRSRSAEWMLRRAGALTATDPLLQSRLGNIRSITVDGEDLPRLSTAKGRSLRGGVSVGPMTFCGYSARKLLLFDRFGVFAPLLQQVEDVRRDDLTFDFRCLMSPHADASLRSLSVVWQVREKEVNIDEFAAGLLAAWLRAQPFGGGPSANPQTHVGRFLFAVMTSEPHDVRQRLASRLSSGEASADEGAVISAAADLALKHHFGPSLDEGRAVSSLTGCCRTCGHPHPLPSRSWLLLLPPMGEPWETPPFPPRRGFASVRGSSPSSARSVGCRLETRWRS